MRPVALLTDFGLSDHYVGVVHAVLEKHAPGVPRIDIDHLVPPGDPKSLARVLLKLLLQPELRRKMGLWGRSRVRSLYSIKQMVNRYEDLIQDVCQKKNFNS